MTIEWNTIHNDMVYVSTFLRRAVAAAYRSERAGEVEWVTKVEWINESLSCVSLFTGIIASPLIKRFGWRAVAMCGSFISAIGFGTSALCTSIYPLYFTYGVLTGNPSQPFPRRRVFEKRQMYLICFPLVCWVYLSWLTHFILIKTSQWFH